jgi:hyperosmotically inducible periplasmic protein
MNGGLSNKTGQEDRMMRYVNLFGACILATTVMTVPTTPAAAAGGEKGQSTGQGVKSEVSDSWLTAKTKIALFADDRVKGSEINVVTNARVVHLRGKVDSREAKSAAAEVARGIDGVSDVKNELQVVPPKERKAAENNDKEITRQVNDRLSKDAGLKRAKIDVRTDAGVVVLSGEVPNITTSARASELARSIPGVRSVKNDLTMARSTRVH